MCGFDLRFHAPFAVLIQAQTSVVLSGSNNLSKSLQSLSIKWFLRKDAVL